jgi:hypothetical protein
MIKNCVVCKEPIHPKRLQVLPNTTRCVKCSDVQKKGAVTIMRGQGEDTWIETIHLEHEEYKAYMKEENKLKKLGKFMFDDSEPKSDIPYGFHEEKPDE